MDTPHFNQKLYHAAVGRGYELRYDWEKEQENDTHCFF
uniref:Uncharacterized protein n=1 Tax=Faecalibaculum rodentium TaxID=1702221 RepID=A0A140DT62_9FIRM|nr:hypothetical protein AALO17_07050 [Faecalibaculum rodentium]